MNEMLTRDQEMKYGLTAMNWYGWGSPVGLGVFIVCLAAAACIARLALYGF
jgi:hypothetical protein